MANFKERTLNKRSLPPVWLSASTMTMRVTVSEKGYGDNNPFGQGVDVSLHRCGYRVVTDAGRSSETLGLRREFRGLVHQVRGSSFVPVAYGQSTAAGTQSRTGENFFRFCFTNLNESKSDLV